MDQPEHTAPVVEVCAPFAGVARLQVAEGETITVGQPVAVVEAVKLEAPVVAPCSGTVTGPLVTDFADVSGGDLLLRIVPGDPACADRPQAGA